MKWREELFLNLGILTFLAVVAAIVGVACALARIGVPDQFIRALLWAGAVWLLYGAAPAVATKCQKWAG